MRKTWLVLLLLLLLVCILFFSLRGRRQKGEVVDLAVASRRANFQSFVNASGEIVASRYAEIGSSVMGRLVDLEVAEGDSVAAGQVLARIDPVQAASEVDSISAQLAALEAELAGASARQNEAEKALERARALFDQGLTPKAELDAALASAESARAQAESAIRRVAQGRAQVARARDSLAKTEITAPMAGTVTRLSVREGEMVVIGVQNQPGSILMTVSDLSGVNAEVKVAEADVLRLAVGQTAVVTLEAAPGKEWPGKVIEIGASALPTAGTASAAREFRVVIRLDLPDASLRPGLTCDVRILAQEKTNALTVPLQAVVLRTQADGSEQTGVLAVTDNRVKFVPVSLGILGGLDAEISGIEEGTTLVAGPFQQLRDLKDGDLVRDRAKVDS